MTTSPQNSGKLIFDPRWAMTARADSSSIPVWQVDELDSFLPPEPAAPYFDTNLNAWVLSRYADILAAFRASSLFPASCNSAKPATPMPPCEHLKMRTETIEALPASRINAWRDLLQSQAEAQAASLPSHEPVELLEAYARPLCLSLAAMVTGISLDLARQLYEAAAQVSAAAAEPFDPEAHRLADLANEELKPHFRSGAESLRDSGFVALSQTMPCILGNALYALTQHPEAWKLLHSRPELIDHAVEELLRHAGLVRILGRMAEEDIDLNGTTIRKGQRIILQSRPGAILQPQSSRDRTPRRRPSFSRRRWPRLRRSQPDPHGGGCDH
jgi:cytochrome P450